MHEDDFTLVDHRARTYLTRDDRTLWPNKPIVHHVIVPQDDRARLCKRS